MSTRTHRRLIPLGFLAGVLAVVIALGFSATALASNWTDLPDSMLVPYKVTADQVAAVSVGFPSGLWLPQKTISKAQFVKMADAAFDVSLADPAVGSYSDVDEQTNYYYQYIEGALADGLITVDSSGAFHPNALITREQAAAIVARGVALDNGYNLDVDYPSARVATILSRFSDGGSVSSQLRTAVAFAVDKGLVSGNSAGKLAPKGLLTRIQGVAIIIRAGVPSVTAVYPSFGSDTGGTQVTITGTGFAGLNNAGAVKFGMKNALSYSVDSPTQITAVSPPGTAGTTVDIQVTNSSGTSPAVTTDHYLYSQTTPTVLSVTPGTGPVAGGNTVIITGSGFTGATAVMFGASLARSFQVISSTQITAVAPAGTSGTIVNVTVRGWGGSSAITAADHYSYGLPTVTSVSPGAGLAAGGSTVVITGTGLSGVTAVLFGLNQATTFTLNSSTQITAVVPKGTANGTVDITVVGPGGTSAAVMSDHYTYGPPMITSVAPSGYGSMIIYGAGFNGLSGPTAVQFDSTNAASYQVVSDTEIIATAPAVLFTVPVITVINAAGTSNAFYYQ